MTQYLPTIKQCTKVITPTVKITPSAIIIKESNDILLDLDNYSGMSYVTQTTAYFYISVIKGLKHNQRKAIEQGILNEDKIIEGNIDVFMSELLRLYNLPEENRGD